MFVRPHSAFRLPQSYLHSDFVGARDAARISQETLLLHHEELSGLILTPLTRYAAGAWAENTQWQATAIARTSLLSLFDDATPLMIAIHPNGDKFQMWAQPSEVIFTDQTGSAVASHRLANEWDRFAPLILLALRLSPVATTLFPRDKDIPSNDSSICGRGPNDEPTTKLSLLFSASKKLNYRPLAHAAPMMSMSGF